MATVKSRQMQTVILIDRATLEQINRMAADAELSRSDIIRRLIRLGLKVEREFGMGKSGAGEAA